jgi:hypothetical protein
MDLIAHPSATIVPYVYSLLIDQGKYRHIELFQALFLRLPRFNFLRGLELRNIRWCDYQTLSIDSLVSAFKNVTDLRIYKLAFDDPTDFWSVVARLPSLQRLSVTNAAFFINLSYWPADLDVADVLPRLRPPKIHDLVLSDTDGDQTHILEWFSSRVTLLDSLTVDLEGIALHQCLRGRHPRMSLRSSAYGLPESGRYLLDLENDTRSGSVWRTLDDVLSTLSGLRTVRFTLISCHPVRLTFVNYVKSCLSSCNTRGLLSFERDIGGMSESDPELEACHSTPFCTDQDMFSPPYLRPTSQNGTVTGPFCVTRLQEPTA